MPYVQRDATGRSLPSSPRPAPATNNSPRPPGHRRPHRLRRFRPPSMPTSSAAIEDVVDVLIDRACCASPICRPTPSASCWPAGRPGAPAPGSRSPPGPATSSDAPPRRARQWPAAPPGMSPQTVRHPGRLKAQVPRPRPPPTIRRPPASPAICPGTASPLPGRERPHLRLPMTDAAPSASSAAQAGGPAPVDADWHPGVTITHDDPCSTRWSSSPDPRHPFTGAALSAGPPLVDNCLTPSLLPRAAARAGLSARIVRKPARGDHPSLLPANPAAPRPPRLHPARTPAGWLRRQVPPRPANPPTSSVANSSPPSTPGWCVSSARASASRPARPRSRPLRSNWFWGTVFENWRLYRDTLLAALVVNLFALAIPMFSMTVYDRVVPNHAVETLWVLAIGAILVLGFDFACAPCAPTSSTPPANASTCKRRPASWNACSAWMDARPASVGSLPPTCAGFEGVRDFIASATVTTLIDLPFVLLFLVVMAWISPWLLVPPLVGDARRAVRHPGRPGQDARAHRKPPIGPAPSATPRWSKASSASKPSRPSAPKAASSASGNAPTLFIAQIGGRLQASVVGTVNFAQPCSSW